MGYIMDPWADFYQRAGRVARAYAYGLQRSFYGPMTFRSKVTYLRFSLCKRPQREQYKSYAEVGNTTEGSELPRFVKSCHMRKPWTGCASARPLQRAVSYNRLVTAWRLSAEQSKPRASARFPNRAVDAEARRSGLRHLQIDQKFQGSSLCFQKFLLCKYQSEVLYSSSSSQTFYKLSKIRSCVSLTRR